jgi:hypothetical protein
MTFLPKEVTKKNKNNEIKGQPIGADMSSLRAQGPLPKPEAEKKKKYNCFLPYFHQVSKMLDSRFITIKLMPDSRKREN